MDLGKHGRCGYCLLELKFCLLILVIRDQRACQVVASLCLVRSIADCLSIESHCLGLIAFCLFDPAQQVIRLRELRINLECLLKSPFGLLKLTLTGIYISKVRQDPGVCRWLAGRTLQNLLRPGKVSRLQKRFHHLSKDDPVFRFSFLRLLKPGHGLCIAGALCVRIP